MNYIATGDTEVTPDKDNYCTPGANDVGDLNHRQRCREQIVLPSGEATSGASATGVDRSASSGELDRSVKVLAAPPHFKLTRNPTKGKPYTNGYFTYFLMEAREKKTDKVLEIVLGVPAQVEAGGG